MHRIVRIPIPINLFLGRRWVEERNHRHLRHRLPQTFLPRLECRAGSVLTPALCAIGPFCHPPSLCIYSDVPSVGNFAFGSRFAGQLSSQQQHAKEEKPSSSARHGYGIDTSPEVRSYIQHLSKPDSRTRHKALLGLKVALEENPDLGAALLQYWSTQFSKMMKDPSKHVRIASCQVTATLSKSVGRKMGAIIKDVFPPLYFAQFDEQDVGVIASNVMQAMLPGDKSNAAVDLCTDKVWLKSSHACICDGDDSLLRKGSEEVSM